MTKCTWVMLVLALAPACKKKDSGEAAKGVEGGPDSPFSAWQQPDAAKAWQGTWAGHLTLRTSGTMSMAGDPSAITITGDKATVFDGKTDQQVGFKITTPCSAEFQLTKPDGAVYSFPKHFILRGGKLQIGDGAVGMRKGKSAIVCTTDVVTVDDKGACQKWDDLMHKWNARPETCAWSQKDGKDVLTIGSGDWKTEVIADGDVLASQQFDEEVKQDLWKSSDDKAARAWASEQVKANDPGEQAKAAGGKVGDTSTVAGLQASYAADKSLKGKQVEVSGWYLNNNTATANGVTSYNTIVANADHDMKVTLTCNTKSEVKGLMQWDKVTVKGTVDEAFDKPELNDCTVTKAK